MCGAALRQRRPLFAACLCLAFHGLLRANEFLSIRPMDWVPSPNGRTAILSLPASKGFSRTDNIESVVFTDPVLIRWFAPLISALPLRSPIMGMTYAQFSSIFRQLSTGRASSSRLVVTFASAWRCDTPFPVMRLVRPGYIPWPVGSGAHGPHLHQRGHGFICFQFHFHFPAACSIFFRFQLPRISFQTVAFNRAAEWP